MTITTTATHANNFNLMRLVAAWLVMFGHSFDLYGLGEDPLAQHLGAPPITFYALACFFTISGYLITASWEAQKSLWRYVANRLLRIAPALAIITLISVFLWGPALTALPLRDYFAQKETWKFLNNITIFSLHYNLPGVFTDQPSNVFNSSLWTIKLEFNLYLTLAAIGLLRLLRPSIILTFALCLLMVHGVIDANFTDASHPSHLLGFKYYKLEKFTLWGGFFFLGSAAFLHKALLPLRAPWFWAALTIGWGAWYLVPNGGHLLYLCLAYAVLYLGLSAPAVNIPLIQKNDISYGTYLYAYPMQQSYLLLVGSALGFLGFVALSTALTFAAGYLSWRFIEQPALRLKPRAKKA